MIKFYCGSVENPTLLLGCNGCMFDLKLTINIRAPE